MESTLDETKGRVKEAVGDLVDDKALKRSGRRDRAAAKVKGKLEKAVDRVKKSADAVD